jgi:hypothetical protein
MLGQIGQVIQVSQQVAGDFLERRNVVACGVGFKIRGDEQTSIPSIIVSVTHKEPPQSLGANDLIPQAIRNITTDVVETGEIEAYDLDRRLVIRPLRPGASIGHRYGTTGTLGCLVRRGEQDFILGNNHVLARLNDAKLGDPILQPGAADGGKASDEIGRLATYVPIRFLESTPTASSSAAAQSVEPQGCSQGLKLLLDALGSLRRSTTAQPLSNSQPDNQVDAALVSPFSNIALDGNIIDLGGCPLGVVEPKLGMHVVKSGRTTGVTEAQIVQVDVTVNVRYGDRLARFSNQIMTTPFSQPGDSGSLVLDFERKAVGLLFSGSSQITVVNPINLVLSILDVELVTA